MGLQLGETTIKPARRLAILRKTTIGENQGIETSYCVNADAQQNWLTIVLRSGYDDRVLKLRFFREQRNISFRELSRKAGVGLATLVRLEAGKFDPRLSTLRKLAKALGVTICQLLGEQPKKGGR